MNGFVTCRASPSPISGIEPNWTLKFSMQTPLTHLNTIILILP